MSHYDNSLDDFGPLPENYTPGNSRKPRTPRRYPDENTGVPIGETVSTPRIRPGGKTRPESEAANAPRGQRKSPAAKRPVAAPAKTPTTEDDTDMTRSGFVRFFTDHRTHKFVGLLLVAISVFLLIATVSHLRSGDFDQSRVVNSTLAEMRGTDTANVAGPVGAKISYTITTQWLGLGAIPLIFYFAIIGISLLGIRKCRFWNVSFQCLLIGITLSVCLGLIGANVSTPFVWGGEHGRFVNEFLVSYTGYPGAIAVSALLAGAVVLVYFNYISAFVKARRAEYAARRERNRQARMELERQRAEAEAALAEANSALASEEVAENEPIMNNREVNNSETHDFIDLDELVSDKDEVAEPDDQGNDDTTSHDHGFMVDETDTHASTAADVDGPVEPAVAACSLPEVPAAVAPADAGFSVDDDPDAEEYAPQSNQPEDENATSEESTEPDKPLSAADAPMQIEAGVIEQARRPDAPVYDPTAELSRYRKPPLELLNEATDSGVNIDIDEQEANKQRIIKTLLEYGIPITEIKATVGPTITLFEIVPAEGVRIASIRRLEDDIARSLAAEGIRIVAPIPGRGTVGIEVPNHTKHTVSMRSVLSSQKYLDCKMALPMAIGTTISNEVFIRDLAKIPHLLVAGATGQGKSVGLNAIITSLIYKRHPAELKFVLIDPKMVEFSLYGKLERHFLAKIEGEEDAIVTDPEKVKATLNSLCLEMDNRYRLLRSAYVRSLEEYNEKFVNHRLNPENGHRYLPYIVVIVDEFADLIMMGGKDVEMPIARLAQKARAIGIHLIIATQRPSTDVITGMIKANFPGRVAFRVAQMVDSKTILDRPGANSLIGKGDMLFSWNSLVDRVQCAFVSTKEVSDMCDWIEEQIGYDSAYYLPEYVPEGSDNAVGGGAGGDRDSLFAECATFIVSSGTASTSSLQRKFSIGYNRAGKIMDQLEAAHIVGPANGGKPRAILVDMITLDSIINN